MPDAGSRGAEAEGEGDFGLLLLSLSLTHSHTLSLSLTHSRLSLTHTRSLFSQEAEGQRRKGRVSSANKEVVRQRENEAKSLFLRKQVPTSSPKFAGLGVGLYARGQERQ